MSISEMLISETLISEINFLSMTSELPASPSEIYVDNTKLLISIIWCLRIRILEKKDPLSDNTIEDEDSLVSLGGKRTKVITHDQATSLIAHVKEISELSDIIDDAENDDDMNNNHSSQIRETFPRTNCEQERFRGLLHKLFTPIKRKTTKTNNENEDSGDVKDNDKRVKDQQARTQVYNAILKHLSNITRENLRKKTQKARNIFEVFSKIGIKKVKRVQSYNMDNISKLTGTQIKSIIAHFTRES
ncbi:13161_t:CDS:2 [Funneliformis geosporum]|nr:13161_t:CDS:2 [Funneliformis geosporum]